MDVVCNIVDSDGRSCSGNDPGNFSGYSCEVNGEATINIKNSDSRPALLYSQILPVENDDENLIVLTPPVARVDPGETQAIRFLLQTTEPLKVQRSFVEWYSKIFRLRMTQPE